MLNTYRLGKPILSFQFHRINLWFFGEGAKWALGWESAPMKSETHSSSLAKFLEVGKIALRQPSDPFSPPSLYPSLPFWTYSTPKANIKDYLESQSSFDLISGSPAPSVIWWKEGSVYDDTYELLSSKEKTVTNTLRYSKLSRDDAAAKFTCQASNTKQTPPIATDTHVTLNRKWNESWWRKYFPFSINATRCR